ncbi:MAG: protein N-terminal glutamine amidohydrolase [Gammaproteobacteria bacterium]|nr:protein N-terminal glutamine amidohydrolase [Gammaproteobacteria bacterium]
MINFDINNYLYTPLFCEENIWKLSKALYLNKRANPMHVLFIINRSGSIALFNQKRSINQQAVVWDYHVILTAQLESSIVVYDFDSKCDFPVNINKYFNNTFPANVNLADSYKPMIKVIKAKNYLRHFYSDRHHMKGLIKSHEYPDYEIITPERNIEKLSLLDCIDIDDLKYDAIMLKPEDYLTLID